MASDTLSRESGSGHVGRVVSSETWSQLRNGAGTTASTTVGDKRCGYHASSTIDEWNEHHFLVLIFDLVGQIDVDAVFTAATLRLYVKGVQQNLDDDHPIIHDYPSFDGSLDSGDYTAFSLAGDFSDDVVAISTLTTSAYNTWDFNADGLAYLQAQLDGQTDDAVLVVLLRNMGSNGAAPTWVANAEDEFQIDNTATNPAQLALTFDIERLVIENENLNMVENIVRFSGFIPVVNEAVNMVENVVRNALVTVVVDETLNIVEAAVRVAAFIDRRILRATVRGARYLFGRIM